MNKFFIPHQNADFENFLKDLLEKIDIDKTFNQSLISELDKQYFNTFYYDILVHPSALKNVKQKSKIIFFLAQ